MSQSMLRAHKLFDFLLMLYPDNFRKKFGNDMRLILDDLCNDELETQKSLSMYFWFSILLDTSKSICEQHLHLIKKQGIRKYLQISIFNIIGLLLLFPFLLLFGIDFLGRLAQWDFTQYNHAWYTVISKTFLYTTYNGQAPFLWTTLILFPFLAIILNSIPFLLKKNKTKHGVKLFIANPFTTCIIALGLFCLLVVIGHDAIPCTIHGIMSHGLGNTFQVLSICQNA